jgi:hypothetical protein
LEQAARLQYPSSPVASSDRGQGDVKDALLWAEVDFSDRWDLLSDVILLLFRKANILSSGQTPVHHRVEDTSLYPTVKLSDVGITQKGSNATNFAAAPVVPATPATTPPPPMLIPATMAKYDQMFDDMDEVGKAESIVSLPQIVH